MSVDELKNLAWSYYTDRKKEIIIELDTRSKSPKTSFLFSEIIDRLEYELVVVDLMGFNGYFNIVSDFIIYAKENGVPVGPGRGSAAGAILAYLSKITDIDPLPYGLLFERFLNPSRVSMPDIDVDFQIPVVIRSSRMFEKNMEQIMWLRFVHSEPWQLVRRSRM
jgi:DNA polymerase-3 subunit alpha